MKLDVPAETNKIIHFIQTVFSTTGKSTAIIGLSGGIDSAASFALTAKALGPDHIRVYYLPAKSSPPQNLIDIKQLTPNVCVIPIGSIIQKSWRVIKKYEKYKGMEGIGTSHTSILPIPQINKLRLANLATRIRMQILFDQAKALDALVIGTENRSETLLGYFTRFGDAASDLEPIAHLYKTQVIELAKYLHLPDSIITKPPSADLWPHQTDAAELGFTYAQADPILMQLAAGETPTGALAEQVIARVNANQFKQQVPYTLNLSLFKGESPETNGEES